MDIKDINIDDYIIVEEKPYLKRLLYSETHNFINHWLLFVKESNLDSHDVDNETLLHWAKARIPMGNVFDTKHLENFSKWFKNKQFNNKFKELIK